MKAIILAAGKGERLRPLTSDRPKCLVPFLEKPLLAYQLEALNQVGIDDITIVGGYQCDQLKPYGYPVIENPDYDTTNMVKSLSKVEPLIADESEDFLVCYSDILYEPRLLRCLMEEKKEQVVLADLAWKQQWERRFDDPLEDAEVFKMDDKGHLIQIGQQPTDLSEIEAQYIGLCRFSAQALRKALQFYAQLSDEEHYDGKTKKQLDMTRFLQLLIDAGQLVSVALTKGGWVEFDSIQDLRLYEGLSQKKTLSCFIELP